MQEINPHQIKRIHILKSSLRLDDDSYRAMLSGYGVSTSKELTFSRAAELIVKMESMILRMKVNSKARPQTQLKYDDLGSRPGMASPGQLRLIDVLWSKVSRQPDQTSRDKALGAFIDRIVKIQKIEWLEPRHVKKIVTALKKMDLKTVITEAKNV
jgi:hypothetical protein